MPVTDNGSAKGDQPARKEKKRERSKRSERRSRATSAPVTFDQEQDDELPTAMELALRRAMGDEEIDAITSGDRGSKKKRRKNRREKSRSQQEEILNRTLQMQAESDES